MLITTPYTGRFTRLSLNSQLPLQWPDSSSSYVVASSFYNFSTVFNQLVIGSGRGETPRQVDPQFSLTLNMNHVT